MNPHETISQQVKDLSHPDATERRQAAEALSAGDERALYPLIKALRDENTGVQDAAMRSLIAIGGEITAYMTLPLLREDAYLRNTTRIILRQIGEPAIPLFRSLLKDKDDDVRIFAVDLIGEIRSCGYPQDIADLLESDPNPNVRSSAARTIGRLGYTQAIPRLQSALKDEEWVAVSALEALAEFHAESAADRIAGLLSSPSETLRYAAIEALGNIASPASSGPLLNYLATAGDFEKTAIVKSLVQIGISPSMSEVYELLIDIFLNADWEDKLIALRGLANLQDPRAIRPIVDLAGSLDPSEPESEERITAIQEALSLFGCSPELIEVLKDPSVKFRGKVLAIDSLAVLACSEAVPTLIHLMEGNLREVRRASAAALAEISGDAAMQALRDSIEDRDGHVRRAAAVALGRIGDRASFEPLLNYLPTERYQDVFEEMVKALLMIDQEALCARLGTLNPAAREIVGRYARDEQALLTLSNDPVRVVRLAALSGLGSVRSGAAEKRLLAALADADPEMKKAAIASLGSMNSGVEQIILLLNDKDTWVRLSAVTALAASGSEAMIDSLAPLLMDPEAPVCFAAIDAIARIGGRKALAALGQLKNHHEASVRERIAEILENLA